MKKILGVLGLILIGVTSYSKIEDTTLIKVTGEVLNYIELKNVGDLDFGDIIIGSKAESKQDAILEIKGETYDNIKLEWAVEGTNNYQSIDDPLNLIMKKGNNCLEAKISLVGESSLVQLKKNNQVKNLKFRGEIAKVPNVPEGIYEGTFVVRYIVGNEN